MKYLLLAILLLSMRCIAGNSQLDADTNHYVRLVEVSHSGNEVSFLIARFEPVSIRYGGGGGGLGKPFGTPIVTKAGDEFTIEFGKQKMTAHEQTLCNVIESCKGPRGSQTLKLNLILSVPADAQKKMWDGDRDFSCWVIHSVGIHE